MKTFSGFWPALITPYTRDDRINEPTLRALVRYLLAKQVCGFYVCGSTGEGLFLSVDERMLITEAVLDEVAGRVPVIAHVGAAALNDAVRLASHAEAAGAAAISSILPPVVYDPRGVVPYFERVAAAAPSLAFLPYLFGYSRDAVALMHDLTHIPTLAGTKYTAPNMYEMRRIVSFREEGWTVFSGMDEQAALGLMYGAAGMIGSTLNVMAGAYREIFAAVRTGRHSDALAWQEKANAVTELMIETGFVGSLREGLRGLGYDCGAPRVPNLPLSEEQASALRTRLEALNFAQLADL